MKNTIFIPKFNHKQAVEMQLVLTLMTSQVDLIKTKEMGKTASFANSKVTALYTGSL